MSETNQFELAKLDYSRLGTQEQSLMSKRTEIWTRFFAILVIPTGYAGIVGVKGAVYLAALVPFFIVCTSLDIKHDEQVLRHDVRKQMKLIAREWGFENHDSKYAKQNENGKRWYQGYYKYGRSFAFLMAEVIAATILYFNFDVSLYGIPLHTPLTLLNILFIVITAWCML